MSVSFEPKGKWKQKGPGKFAANIKVEGAPVTVFAEFDTKTGGLKSVYRTHTAALKDGDPMPKVGDKIVVTVKPMVGKKKVTEHDL